jgi:hypothetical protein
MQVRDAAVGGLYIFGSFIAGVKTATAFYKLIAVV